jgi:hypothetical protein
MKLRKSIWVTGFLMLSVILSSCNLGATPAPTQDPASIQQTAMAQVLSTVSSQQTQTAAALPPPTNTLLPTNTLAPLTIIETNTPIPFATQPGLTPLVIPTITIGAIATTSTKNGCNDGLYIGETAPADNTEFSIGDIISKAWTIKNTGTCDWDEGYAFVFVPEGVTDNGQLCSPDFSGEDIVLTKSKPEDYTKVNGTQSFVVKIKAPKVAGVFTSCWRLRDDGGNYFGPLVWSIIQVRKP